MQNNVNVAVSSPTIGGQLTDGQQFIRKKFTKGVIDAIKQAATCLKYAQEHINWPNEKCRNIL